MQYLFGSYTRISFLLLLGTGFQVSAAPFGVASGFTVFSIGDVTQENSDIEGRLAAGGNVNLTNFSVGSRLKTDGTRLDLIAGGDLTFRQGQVANGSATYGGIGTFISFGSPNGDVIQTDPAIDFAAAKAALIRESNSYAALGGTNVTREYTSLYLRGSDTGLNVFYLAPGSFAGIYSLNISVPTGSTVLVNVAGLDNKLTGGMSTGGLGAEKVLFNFFETTSLQLSGMGFQGTILAPKAAMTFNNGNIDGSLIVASLTGTGESHYRLFNGTLPAAHTETPEPATWCLAGVTLVLLVAIRGGRPRS